MNKRVRDQGGKEKHGNDSKRNESGGAGSNDARAHLEQRYRQAQSATQEHHEEKNQATNAHAGPAKYLEHNCIVGELGEFPAGIVIVERLGVSQAKPCSSSASADKEKELLRGKRKRTINTNVGGK